MLVFDIESNGLLDTITTIHCIVTYDTESKVTRVYNDSTDTVDGSIADGIAALEAHECLCGHNIQQYDIPAIKLCGYPKFKPRNVYDTLIVSYLIWTDIKNTDFNRYRKDKTFMSAKYIGRHSLAAWGARLGENKADYKGGWEEWNQDMEDYCVQDVMVNVEFLKLCESKDYSPVAIQLEHAVNKILFRQENHGFYFDQKKAAELHAMLAGKKLEAAEKLATAFPAWYVPTGTFVPKADNKRFGYTKGAMMTKVKYTEFNPGSRDHIATRLMRKYGWLPSRFGKDGKPTVDEAVLAELDYPEINKLKDYLLIDKRLGMLAEGRVAWLKMLKADGAIHGRVFGNGAVTGRMTHSYPNVAQVPASRSPYGKECRRLFRARPGKVLVGIDASGLELRCLAHYMNDAGYTDTILNGDIHTANQAAAGIDNRDDAKTFIYAFLYGAGDGKIGSIVGKGAVAGKKLKRQFLAKTPALAKLIKGVKRAAARGYLKALDGRHIHVRSEHAALNSLLQSAGALVMKMALVILDDWLQEAGMVPGVDYEFVANVHDEWQIESLPGCADMIGQYGHKAIKAAGEFFKFTCPLAGDFKVGDTWADTH